MPQRASLDPMRLGVGAPTRGASRTAAATGEWFGDHESGLDKDGVFGPPTPRATSEERAPAGHLRPR